MNYRFGLTGDIASGKSAASKYLKDKGYYVIDADIIAREVVSSGSIGYFKVKEEFPESFEDGKLNRKKLASIIFNSKEKKIKLENILHPLIRERIIELMHKDEKIIFLDAPLLFEGKYEDMLDAVIYIYAELETRVERIIKRDKLTRQEAISRIQSFEYPVEEKIKKSFVIDNSYGIENLYFKLDEFLEKNILT